MPPCIIYVCLEFLECLESITAFEQPTGVLQPRWAKTGPGTYGEEPVDREPTHY